MAQQPALLAGAPSPQRHRRASGNIPPARGSLQPASPPPPQRDTVFVPPSEDGIIPGWAKVVYYSGTAGVWPIHCHIDWHMSAGLMAFIVEDAPKLARASAELSPAFL